MSSSRTRSGYVRLAVLCVCAAAVAPAAVFPGEVTSLESVGCGELLWRRADGLVPLPAVRTDVALEVNGPLIAGTVSQLFTNPTDQVIEAIYVFPLPENAAVHAMEIIVGERRIVSVVQEREQARRTYVTARASGRRAALVEGERPNLFTTSVANICPGDRITVELRYLDRADFDGGEFGLAFPLTFTPRYIPPAMACTEEGALSAARVSPTFAGEGDRRFPVATVRVELNPGVALADVRSDSHDLDLDRDGDLWLASPAGGTIPADRDFLLAWRPSVADVPATALFVEDRPDGRYALLMVVPAAEIVPPRRREPIPTETLFLVDVSGSMQGESIVQARTALLRALDRLGPQDRFNILAFANDSRIFRRDFQAATPSGLADARAWVRMLDANGGTELHPALLRATSRFSGGDDDDGYSRRIILITDAAIGNEAQLLREATVDMGPVRLHVVGIGSAPNRYLVRRLAEYGGGLSAFVNSAAGAGNGIDAFLERISRPQLADPRLAWRGDGPAESYPERLPEVYAGELVLWSGRFPPGADLRGAFTAALAGEGLSYPLGEAETGGACDGVAVRWARLKVAGLMADFHRGADRDGVRAQVVETGLAFGLVTAYTSRMAVEEAVSADAPARPCRLSGGLPHGTEFASSLPATGTSEPLLRLLGALGLLIGSAGVAMARR
ncbi:VWA domain-containing protein, partial [bacterium]|nr:VWA domain-containing protein [bacterium]MBU1675287.1 VWA domain-containing protein [bacterium]